MDHHFDERQHRFDQQHQGWDAFEEESEHKRRPLPAANQKAADAATKRMVAQGRGPSKPSNEPFAAGTELYVSRTGGYHHSGIYVGNNEVVHVFAEPMSAAKALLQGDPIVTVVKTSLSKYLDGASLSAVQHGPSPAVYTGQTATSRATARVGEAWSYNPFTHNCQHFTSWVVSGSSYSPEAAKIQHAFEALPPEVQAGVTHAAQAVGAQATEVASAAKDKLMGAEHKVEKAATSVVSKAVDAGQSFLKKLSFW